jgi:hypothetical protein
MNNDNQNFGVDEPLRAQSGTKVRLELVDETGASEAMDVQIVPDDFADVSKGYLGLGTPLAAALEGHLAGESIAYEMGDIRSVRILEVSLAEEGPDVGIAERREQAHRKALNETDRTNAILFASSFNGKWGDYDPSSLNNELDEE